MTCVLIKNNHHEIYIRRRALGFWGRVRIVPVASCVLMTHCIRGC